MSRYTPGEGGFPVLKDEVAFLEQDEQQDWSIQAVQIDPSPLSKWDYARWWVLIVSIAGLVVALYLTLP